MKKTPIIIALIFSATILIMYYSYHFYFTNYAKCMEIEKYKIETRSSASKRYDKRNNISEENYFYEAKEYCLEETK